MAWQVKESLTPEEMEAGLRTVLWQGVWIQAMLTLSGGAFLVALALKLGANNFQIGILAAIPPLAQLIQIPSIFLVERVRVRRKVAVYASSIGRIFLLSIALAPILVTPHLAIWVLCASLLLKNSFSAVTNCAWNSWMRDLVPRERLGGFFGKRHAYFTVTAMILSMLAALFLDFWGKAFSQHVPQGYAIIFFLGLLAGIMTTVMIARVPEPAMVVSRAGFMRRLRAPFKDANFRNLIYFLGTWNLAVNLAAPFFTVYLIKGLGYPMVYVIGLGVISQLVSVFFFKVWGQFADRYSNKAVLRISGPIFIACLLGWTFVTFPEDTPHRFTLTLLIILHICMGIATSGTNLSASNIAIKLAPKAEATGFLAASNLVNSLVASLAPLIGGRFVDFFSVRKLAFTFTWETPGVEKVFHVLKFQQWDFFFLFAFLVGIFSIHRLTRVQEVSVAKEDLQIREVMQQVGRQMRNFSTVGGLRELIEFPFVLLRYRRRKEKEVSSPSQAPDQGPPKTPVP